MKRFWIFFFGQMALYGLIAFNVRALAAGNIPTTVLTDVLIASVSFTVIKRIGEAGKRVEFFGYILGGAFGSVIALWVAKH